jgi:iron complex outermembrane recepter protein
MSVSDKPARPVFTLLTLALAISATSSALAQPKTVDEITITGQRIGQQLDRIVTNGALGQKSLLDTPFSITVIGKDEIARRQANSVAQIFINDPSVISSTPAGAIITWMACRCCCIGAVIWR